MGIAVFLCSLATAQATEPRKWALLSDAAVQQAGVVAANYSRMFRITIDETAIPKTGEKMEP